MGNNSQMLFWQTDDWSLVHKIELNQSFSEIAISPDGQLLALTFGDSLELWGIPQP